MNKLMVPRGEGQGERARQGVWAILVHTAMFRMENPQGPAVGHRELCSVLRGGLDGRGLWGREMAESLCCPPETIMTLLIGSVCVRVYSVASVVSNSL